MGSPLSEEDVQAMRKAGYIPVSLAAEMTRRSVATIHRWAEDGKVRSLRLRDFFTFVEVRSLIEYLGTVLAKQYDLDALLANDPQKEKAP